MIGLLGKKKGMSSLFDNGRLTPVTILELGPCPVVQVKTPATDGYGAIQIGFGKLASRKVLKPVGGHFKKSGAEPTVILQELRDYPGDPKPGDVLTVDLFKVGDKVDIIARSKGRGFAGVIKRHHFGRPNQSHGTHESFRGGGSIGQHSYPARTWPGQKMAGRLGNDRRTVKNLVVVSVDTEHCLLLVRGAVPGAQGGYVTVRKAGKRN
jgi:large subunit ribosomal protein L3